MERTIRATRRRAREREWREREAKSEEERAITVLVFIYMTELLTIRVDYNSGGPNFNISL